MFSLQIGIPSPSDDITARRVWGSRSWKSLQSIERHQNGSEHDGLEKAVVHSPWRFLLILADGCFESRRQEEGRRKQKPAHSEFAEVTQSDAINGQLVV